MRREEVIQKWAELLSSEVRDMLGFPEKFDEILNDPEKFRPIAEKLWEEVG